MRNALYFFLAVVLATGCRRAKEGQQPEDIQQSTSTSAASAEKPADQAPEFVGVTVEGDTIALSDYRGKVVLIDFWATWCPPCRETIPEISELAERYRNRDVVVLGLSMEDFHKVERFWAQYRPAYAAVVVDKSVFRDYRVQGIPTLFLVDQQGAIRHQEVGFSPKMKARLAEIIDRLLEQ